MTKKLTERADKNALTANGQFGATAAVLLMVCTNWEKNFCRLFCNFQKQKADFRSENPLEPVGVAPV
jgi:hypothetical protein